MLFAYQQPISFLVPFQPLAASPQFLPSCSVAGECSADHRNPSPSWHTGQTGHRLYLGQVFLVFAAKKILNINKPEK